MTETIAKDAAPNGEGLPGTRREFLIGGALLATAAVSSAMSRRLNGAPKDRVRPLEQLAPNTVGRWTRAPSHGVVIPKGEAPEGEVYDDVVTRYYASDFAPLVMLLVAYGSAQAGTTQLHRPEVCYPAAGFRMQRWPDRRIALTDSAAVPARIMTARAPGRTEQLLYWSRVGHDFPTDTRGQRWAVLRATLGGEVPDGALVRMSMIHPDRDQALVWLASFGRSLVAASNAELRRLLVGSI